MPFYFMDYWYLVLVIPALLVTIVAQIFVKSTFNKYSKISTRSGMTGRDASAAIQRRNNLTIPIEGVSGSLTDHYDPRTDTIKLSETVGLVPSISAIGVAAHETGHAMQYANGYAPAKFRQSIIPVCNLISSFSYIFLIVGSFMFSFKLALTVYALMFSFSVLLQLVTLGVEFDASKRAIAELRSLNVLTEDELDGTRKVLTAAALTYVAALLLSVMQLLRVLILLNRRNGD